MKKSIFFLSIFMSCLCQASLPSGSKSLDDEMGVPKDDEMNYVDAKPPEIKQKPLGELFKQFDVHIDKQKKIPFTDETRLRINAIAREPTKPQREKDDKEREDSYNRMSEYHKHGRR